MVERLVVTVIKMLSNLVLVLLNDKKKGLIHVFFIIDIMHLRNVIGILKVPKLKLYVSL